MQQSLNNLSFQGEHLFISICEQNQRQKFCKRFAHMVAFMGIAFLGKQQLGRSNADSSKKVLLKTQANYKWYSYQKGCCQRPRGQQKFSAGWHHSLVTQAQSKCYVGVFQGYFKKKNLNIRRNNQFQTKKIRAKIESKKKLPFKESLINQEPLLFQDRTVSINPGKSLHTPGTIKGVFSGYNNFQLMV